MAYDLNQTVFSLSLASNAVADIKATTSGYNTELTAYMAAGLTGGTLQDLSSDGAFADYQGPAWPGFFPTMNSQLAGGDWQVVWGPCVWVAPLKHGSKILSLYATNSMYVGWSPSLNTYVVAIAATNAANVMDWIDEDFDVYARTTSTWPPTIPFTEKRHEVLPAGTPQISAGTATGISALLGMTDPKQGSLQSFLASKADSSATLWFTGHSLAGALSPTLAFYLYPDPTKSSWGTINLLPSAGATPGNQAWLDLFTAGYPDATDLVNMHDVVPRAWNMLPTVIQPKDKAGNYPSIFGMLGSGTVSVGYTVDLLVHYMERRIRDITYANITHNMFGAADFSSNWGHFTWGTVTTDAQGYTLKSDPAWSDWPPFTDSNPVTAQNPAQTGKATVMGQIGQLITATHIDQYVHNFGLTPSQLLPEVPADWKPQAPDLDSFQAMLHEG
ncbi:triacylglycerol lipase (plasmid) [Tistrella mobilis]|uniref:lipase family protein n=1 Tax=Tistrella mobilis TaxID=171437 RepID=UPI00355879ED